MIDKSLRSRNIVLAGIAALFGTCLLFYWPILDGQRAMYVVDTYAFFEPMCKYLAMRLNQGELPAWNSFLFCGVSQLAVQTPNLFYPPTLLFAWLPFSQALGWNVVFSKVAAGLGGMLLARRLGWGPVSAVFAALLLAFNGSMFALDSNYTLAVTLSWLPWILWVCHRLISDAEQSRASIDIGSANIALLSVFTFLCLSAGRPETIAGVAICAVVFCVYCLWCNEQARTVASARKIILQLLLAIGIAIMLYMPVALPALEWLSLSRRSTGLVSDETLLLSANGYDLAKLWLFPVLGDERLLEGTFTQLAGGGGSLFMPSAYVGPIAVAFAGIALASKQWRARWLVLAGLIAACLLAYGKNFPVTHWLVVHGALLGILRFPVKFLPFVSVAVSFAAAKGVCLIVSQGCSDFEGEQSSFETDRAAGSSRAPWMVALLACLLPAVLAVLIYLMPALSLPLLGFNQTADATLLPRALGELLKAQLLSSAIALCLLVPLLVVPRRNLRLLVSAFVLFAGGMLIINGTMIGRHWATAVFYDQPSFLKPQFMQYYASAEHSVPETTTVQTAPFRVAALFHKSCFLVPLWLLPKEPEQSAIVSAAYSRQMMDSNCNLDFAVPSCWGFETSVTGDYYKVFLQALAYSTQTRRMVFAGDPAQRSDEPLARLLRLGSVEFALSQPLQLKDDGQLTQVPPMDSRFFKLLQSDRTNNYSIYRVLEPFPRARIVHQAHVVDHAAALERYFRVAGTPSGSPPTAREPDDIECDAGTLKQFTTSDDDTEVESQHSASLQERIVLSETKPERLVCETETNAAGFLILADQDYPGWNAFLDGKPTSIKRANGFYRAVGVPAGQHQVVFEFAPSSWEVGCRFCLAGALLLLALIVAGVRNRTKMNGAF